MVTAESFLAFWGAGLSTVLAFLKIWELWVSRDRIEVTHNFSSQPERGNDIILHNVSPKPMIIAYWELQFCDWKGFRWKCYRTIDPEEDIRDVCIQAHSPWVMNFREQNYFDWGWKLEGKRIYLKLHIAGKKRPIRKLVYKGQ